MNLKNRTACAVQIATFALVFAGCAPSGKWPAEIKPGVEVEFSLAGGDGAGRGKVLKVEGEWLSVEFRGSSLQLPREKVTTLRVLNQ